LLSSISKSGKVLVLSIYKYRLATIIKSEGAVLNIVYLQMRPLCSENVKVLYGEKEY
jgi:hypothetical protein